MNYSIVKYDPVYDERICELQKELWSPDYDINKSYLEWKYLESPYSDPPKLYLALHDEKLIAVRGFYEWPFRQKGDSFTALCCADLVIHREYRSKGLYPDMMNFIMSDLHDEGYTYLLSFSAGPTALINSLALGWKVISRMKSIHTQFYMRPVTKKLTDPVTVNKLIKRVVTTKILRKPPGPPKIREELWRSANNLPANVEFGYDPKPGEMARLISGLDTNGKVVLVRDEKYFGWRYRNPLSGYFFLYWQDSELRGYLVAQTPLFMAGSMGSFNVLELEGQSPEIKKELMKALLSLLDFRSATVWSGMLDDSVRRYLMASGFRERSTTKSVAEFNETVLISTTGRDNERIEFHGTNLLDVNNWDFKMTYSDFY